MKKKIREEKEGGTEEENKNTTKEHKTHFNKNLHKTPSVKE